MNNKTAMINAAAETSMVDDGVGRVREALEARHLDNNTLIIYTSDQGSSYGQHGLWGNTSWAFPFPAYNSQLKIPLVFYHPTRIQGGVRSDEIVNQFDMFPTILDYLGEGEIAIDSTLGISFIASLEGKTGATNRAAFFEFITARYSYERMEVYSSVSRWSQ